MHPAFLCVIQSVSDVFIQHCQTAPRCFTARAPSPGSLLPLSSWFLAQWSLSCLSFRRIMPSSCKSQLVWTRHSHKRRCWHFFAKSRFPLTLPFPIPSTLWHAVLGNAWKGAVEGNCLTHSPVIVCYTWITITHHSNVLSLCVCQSLTSFSVGSQTRSWWLFLCETSTVSWRCGDSTEMRSFRWSKGKLQLFSLSFYF